MTELHVFLATVYGGLIIGFLYDLYRIFRYFSRPKKIVTFIEDFIFWIIVTLISITILLISNYGELRGYVFIGFISGAIIYNRLLSKLVIYTLVYFVKMIVRVFKYILNIVLIPFRLIQRVLYTPYLKIRTFSLEKITRLKRIMKLPGRILKDIKKQTRTILSKK